MFAKINAEFVEMCRDIRVLIGKSGFRDNVLMSHILSFYLYEQDFLEEEEENQFFLRLLSKAFKLYIIELYGEVYHFTSYTETGLACLHVEHTDRAIAGDIEKMLNVLSKYGNAIYTQRLGPDEYRTWNYKEGEPLELNVSKFLSIPKIVREY